MGTSSSSGGAGGSNPLIPSWISPDTGRNIDGGGGPKDQLNPNNSQPGDPSRNDIAIDGGSIPLPSQTDPGTNSSLQPIPNLGNRYTQSKRDFNKYVKGNGANTYHLKNALRNYVTRGGGGSSVLSRRMAPSSSRVARFITTINEIKSSGKTQVLTQINLTTYLNKSLNETLSALADEIFRDTGNIFEDTQDDSITKQAYSNTVVRICEIDGITLDGLTNENIALMISIFIEETIAQRVICDIGNKLTKMTSNIQALLEIENNIYQIISGLVRNQIMPEIIATQRGNKQKLNQEIENIYRIAFDSIVGTKE